MDIQPITYDEIIGWLRKQNGKKEFPIVVDARIAISLNESRLLAVQPTEPLQVIQY
jgi:hypothetical protein